MFNCVSTGVGFLWISYTYQREVSTIEAMERHPSLSCFTSFRGFPNIFVETCQHVPVFALFFGCQKHPSKILASLTCIKGVLPRASQRCTLAPWVNNKATKGLGTSHPSLGSKTGESQGKYDTNLNKLHVFDWGNHFKMTKRPFKCIKFDISHPNSGLFFDVSGETHKKHTSLGCFPIPCKQYVTLATRMT